MSIIKKKETNTNLFPNLLDVENFFSNSFFKPAWWGTHLQEEPAVNIKETDEKFEVEMAIPGIKKEDVEIDVENDILTIKSETESKTEEENKNYKRKEFSYSSFCRSFSLPAGANADEISADYKDGLVIISIPKMEIEESENKRKITLN